MALFSPVAVRAVAWDTQQRLPYNRNAPRKIQVPTEAPTFSTVPPNRTNSRKLEIDVNQLLKLGTTISKQVESNEETYMGYERWLPSAPEMEKPRSSYNAAALAYVGDSIYELYARRHFLAPALNLEEYNDRVMAVVRCEAQDALLRKLLNDKLLSDEERDVLRWGRNVTSAKTKTKKRAGTAVYNSASSLETLIGYLYLTDVTRLDEVMVMMGFSVGFSNQAIVHDLDREIQTMKQKQKQKQPRKKFNRVTAT